MHYHIYKMSIKSDRFHRQNSETTLRALTIKGNNFFLKGSNSEKFSDY